MLIKQHYEKLKFILLIENNIININQINIWRIDLITNIE